MRLTSQDEKDPTRQLTPLCSSSMYGRTEDGRKVITYAHLVSLRFSVELKTYFSQINDW